MTTRPSRRKAPKLKPTPAPRTTELIGLTEDGRMVLWNENGQVQPVSKFETIENGRWIASGHYVIDYKGHAITVHCGNMADGSVSLQFMCNRAAIRSFSRAEVERMLIGKVIQSEESKAVDREILKRLTEWAHHDDDDPKRSRGRLS